MSGIFDYLKQREKEKEEFWKNPKAATQETVAEASVMVIQDTEEHIPTGVSINPGITFDEFIGQERAKELVLLNVNAWEANPDNVPGHMLFTGPGGTGKSTIAHAVANRMGTTFITTTPYHLRKPDQIFDFFFNPDYTPKIEAGDIVFIDEVHGFDMRMAGFMYNVLQDFCLDYSVKEPLEYKGKRHTVGDVVRLNIPHFLCVGATTDAGMMHPPLRSRFINRIEFEDYNVEEIGRIAQAHRDSNWNAALAVAERSAGNPRKAKSLMTLAELIRIKHGHQKVLIEDVIEACDLYDIDEKGLDKNAQRVVQFFVRTQNKPAGTNPISASTGVYKTTLDGETFPAMAYAGVLLYTARGKMLDPAYYAQEGGK